MRGIDGRAVEVIHLTKHQTKGNRSRRVFLSDDLRKLINGYLDGLDGTGRQQSVHSQLAHWWAFQQRVAQLAVQGDLSIIGDRDEQSCRAQDVRNAEE